MTLKLEPENLKRRNLSQIDVCSFSTYLCFCSSHQYAYMKDITPGVNLRLVDVDTGLPVKEVESESSVVLETVFYPPPSTNSMTLFSN